MSLAQKILATLARYDEDTICPEQYRRLMEALARERQSHLRRHIR